MTNPRNISLLTMVVDQGPILQVVLPSSPGRVLVLPHGMWLYSKAHEECQGSSRLVGRWDSWIWFGGYYGRGGIKELDHTFSEGNLYSLLEELAGTSHLIWNIWNLGIQRPFSIGLAVPCEFLWGVSDIENIPSHPIISNVMSCLKATPDGF